MEALIQRSGHFALVQLVVPHLIWWLVLWWESSPKEEAESGSELLKRCYRRPHGYYSRSLPPRLGLLNLTQPQRVGVLANRCTPAN